jgi:hypothetical protein
MWWTVGECAQGGSGDESMDTAAELRFALRRGRCAKTSRAVLSRCYTNLPDRRHHQQHTGVLDGESLSIAKA